MQKYLDLFNTYFFWVILALLVFIPLYPKFPLAGVSGTYVAIRLDDIFILGVFALWGIANLFNLRTYFRSTIFQAFLLFWFIGLLSTISGIVITHTVTPNLGLLNWARRVEFMGLFLITATSVRSLRQVKTLLIVMSVVTLIIIFYGFGQQWLHFPIISTENKEFSKGILLYLTGGARVSSTFAGDYDLATYLSMFLAILASLFFISRNFFYKGYLLISGALSFVLLGMTTSRISFGATFAAVAVSLWMTGKKVFIILLVLIAIAVIGTVPELRHRLVATFTVNVLNGGGPKYNAPIATLSAIPTNTRIPDSSRAAYLAQSLHESTISATQAAKVAVDIAPGEPINSTELGVFRSLGIRTNVEWPRAIHAFEKNPILGTGYSSITLATDNDYLRSLGETGLLGSLSLLLIFIAILKRMKDFLKGAKKFDKLFVIGAICSIIALIITGTFIDVLESSKIAEVFWIILGVSWALMGDYKDAL